MLDLLLMHFDELYGIQPVPKQILRNFLKVQQLFDGNHQLMLKSVKRKILLVFFKLFFEKFRPISIKKSSIFHKQKKQHQESQDLFKTPMRVWWALLSREEKETEKKIRINWKENYGCPVSFLLLPIFFQFSLNSFPVLF